MIKAPKRENGLAGCPGQVLHGLKALALLAAVTGALVIPRPGPAAAFGVANITAGNLHTCALTTEGAVTCWGSNNWGQLGDETTTDRRTPARVSGLNDGVFAVDAGAFHTCAVTQTGGLKCWGLNDRNQLGVPTTELCTYEPCSTFPLDVPGLTSGVYGAAAGIEHTCVLTITGGLKCWGSNDRGQLGDGTQTQRSAPVDVSGLASSVIAIAAGGSHTCALTATGGVKCWGDSWAELPGGGGFCGVCTTPVDVPGLASDVASIATNSQHTCVLTTAAGVKCWGLNSTGQLGDSTTEDRHTPVEVVGLTSGVASITAGTDHTCALTTAGGVKCWGYNDVGQLGDGTTTQRTAPVDVSGLTSGVAVVVAGAGYTCALPTAGGVKCWGAGTWSLTPVDIPGAKGVIGDANCNGTVNAIDAALTLQYDARLIASLLCPAAADVNGDGRVDSRDAALILQYVAGLLGSL